MTDETKPALLSKLRAPVADDLPHWEEISAKLERDETLTPLESFIHENEPAGSDAADAWRDQLAAALASAPAPNQATSSGRNMFYEGLFEGETERQRDRRLKWMKTMRPASAPVAFYRQSLRDLVDVVWKEATESTAVPDTAWADRLIDKVFPSVLASAPVAGEALNDLQALQWAEKYGIQWALRTPDAIREVIADAQSLAAPQASEAVRDADHPVFTFLLGEGPLRGVEFGDRHPDERGAYWWRKDLRAALSAQPGAQKEQSDE